MPVEARPGPTEVGRSVVVVRRSSASDASAPGGPGPGRGRTWRRGRGPAGFRPPKIKRRPCRRPRTSWPTSWCVAPAASSSASSPPKPATTSRSDASWAVIASRRLLIRSTSARTLASWRCGLGLGGGADRLGLGAGGGDDLLGLAARAGRAWPRTRCAPARGGSVAWAVASRARCSAAVARCSASCDQPGRSRRWRWSGARWPRGPAAPSPPPACAGPPGPRGRRRPWPARPRAWRRRAGRWPPAAAASRSWSASRWAPAIRSAASVRARLRSCSASAMIRARVSSSSLSWTRRMSSASRLASARVAWASRWACSRISVGVAQRRRRGPRRLLLGQPQHRRGAAAEAGVRRVLVLLELLAGRLECGLQLGDPALARARPPSRRWRSPASWRRWSSTAALS